MQPEDVKQMIEAGMTDADVRVSGDGSHFDAIVISNQFEGKSLIQQQRMVYDTLGDKITSGALHALSIKSYTQTQWEQHNG